jgi:hypothetical protein
MKILIAGDSFAAPYWNGMPRGDLTWRDLPPETSWARLLEKTYNWQVTNLAVAGSSLAYSYLELKKSNLESYDKVIIVVTNPGRVTLNNGMYFCNLATAEQYISGVKDTKSAPPKYAVALAVKSYYEYIYNPELDLLYFEATLKKIIELVPQDKLILINGCCHVISISQDYFNYPVILHDIMIRELEEINVTLQQLQTEFDETNDHINHLTLENKVILSKVVHDLCTIGSSNVTLDDFKKINPAELSLYYALKGSTTQTRKSILNKIISKRAIAKLKKLAK